MRAPSPFTIYCAVILSLFTYTKWYGLGLFGTSVTVGNTTQIGSSNRSSGGSGSGGYYSGNTGGSHK